MLNTLYSGNRLRVDFSKNPQHIDVPNLLQLQQDSYAKFLMLDEKDRSIDTKGNPLLLVEQFCQAYGWSYKKAMKLTYPQILMLAHASHCNHERIKPISEEDKGKDSYKMSFDESLMNISEIASVRMI